jgi:hypothetical protein
MRKGNKVTRKKESKVHPITFHEGTEGEERYTYSLPLTLALDRDARLMPNASHFTPGNDLVPPCIGGWVGPRPGLDRCGKSHFDQDLMPGPSTS